MRVPPFVRFLRLSLPAFLAASSLVLALAICGLDAHGETPAQTFTDTDEDSYTVSLSGPGSLVVTQAVSGLEGKGPIASLVLTDTTSASSLKVTVKKAEAGDGKVQIGAVTGGGSLKSLFAPDCELTGTGLSLPNGNLGTLALSRIADGSDVVIGKATQGSSTTRISTGSIGAAKIQTSGKLAGLSAAEVTGAEITALAIGSVKIAGGSFNAVLSTPGKLVSLSVAGGDLSGRISAQDIGSIKVSKDKSGKGGAIVDCTIVAHDKIGPVSASGDVVASTLIAGANLGADGVLGGTGLNEDSFEGGSIKSVEIGGNVTHSILGAGLSPFDGVFRNGDDGVFGGKRSKLGKLIISGQLSSDSLIGGGAFGQVKIEGKRIKLPQLDARFVSRKLDGVPPPAPDPAKKATVNDPTVPTALADSTTFLYTGENPVQTGVQANAIDAVRAAVVRGKVLARDGTPMPSVMVSILNRPEFGQTVSRADGQWDMATNGGGILNVSFEREGFLPVQRQVKVAMQDYAMVDDVVLLPVDAMVTQVAFGAGSAMQVHQASMQSDADGSRQATLMFQPDTSASLVMPDGTTEPMTSLKIRATEFTVGVNGPKAMPAVLPPTSAYTYCAEFSADEAQMAGATSIQFGKPVWFYLDNFIGFPAGTIVPIGFYNKEKGEWEPGTSGSVIKIVASSNGIADLDSDGDSDADTPQELAALGITDLERQQLAIRYTVGQSLWRSPIPHFSTIDANWAGSPGNPAGAPNGGEPKPNKPPDKVDDPPNVYVQNQVLGESLPIAGTPYNLNYRSNRVVGYSSSVKLRVPLSGATLVGAVKRIDVDLSVAGRTIHQEYTPAPNLEATIEWDGKDAYGRVVAGAQPATVKVSNIYRGTYSGTRRFGYQGEFELAGNSMRGETAVSASYSVTLGHFDIRRQSLGGWTFDVHHVYDPQGRVLYQGDGSVRSVQNVNSRVISTVAGTGASGFSGDGGPATSATLRSPWGVGVLPDGSLLIADRLNHRIRKVDRNGIISTFAGNGTGTFAGDGGPAISASFNEPTRTAPAPDGSIYIDDKNNVRIRRILPDGNVTTAAGTGQAGNTGDDGPAIQARLGGDPDPFIGLDGTVFFSDIVNHRVRRISTDGIISAVAGTGVSGFSGDNGPALQAKFNLPVDLVPTRDGYLFIGDLGNNRIRRVGPDGVVVTVAGGGNDSTTEGVAALSANLNFSTGVDLAPAPDGGIYFTERVRRRIRHLRPDGTIVTIVGNGTSGTSGDGGPALQAQTQNPFGIAVGPDGSLYIGDSDANRVRRVSPPLPGFSAEELAIPSEDGRQLFRFDKSGRHLETRDTFTGATLFTFQYDADGQLSRIIDAHGNATTTVRRFAGGPLAILAPFGQRTELTTDPNGNLSSVREPTGGTWSFVSTAEGLITSETNPLSNNTTYTYDSQGRLLKQDSPGASFYELSRVDLPNAYEIGTADALGQETSYRLETTSLARRIAHKHRRCRSRDSRIAQAGWCRSIHLTRRLGRDDQARRRPPLRLSSAD